MIQIEETKFVKEIIEKDINFPYIGWWSNKKEEIIKIFYEYDSIPNIPKHLKYIIIKNGKNINPSIVSDTISITNGIIDGDIIHLLRDYADIATEKEFQEFRKITLNTLF